MRYFLALLLLAGSAQASTTTLTGTIRDSQGSGLNGTLIMTLPVPAQDTSTSTAVAPGPVFFRLVNGSITGGAPLYDVANLQPQGLYYAARAYDSMGNLQFYGNYVVTGASFSLSSATPTSVTTSNISYSGVGFTNLNNVWTLTNTFQGSTFFTGPAFFKSANSTQFADQQAGATADVQITNALGALSANGGIVDATGYGCTTQTLAAPITIGTVGKIVDLIVDRCTTFNVTITSGVAAITLGQQSSITAIGASEAAPGGTQSGFVLSSSANVSDLLNIPTQATTAGITLDGISLVGNATATVSGAMLHLTTPFQTGEYRGVSIAGNANSYGLKLDAAGGAGPNNFYNLVIDCGGRAGCKNVYINTPNASGVSVGNNFIGGSLTHPGTGGLAIVELADTGANQQNNGTAFFGTQFESRNTGDIGIFCNGCRGLGLYNTSFTANTNAGTAALKISGANADLITVANLNNFNLWTNSIQNTVNGKNITTARVISYVYGPTSALVWDAGFNGDGGGFKHLRTTAGCATAASLAATCDSTVTWTSAFADTNYTPQCNGFGVTSGVPLSSAIVSKAAGNVVFRTVSGTAAAAQFTNIYCTAVHDQ